MTGIGPALLLGVVRIWALLRVQASWRAVLGWRWEWIAGALALCVAGLAAIRGQLIGLELVGAARIGPELVVALGFEFVLGSVLGLAVSLPGWALVGAAGESEAGLSVQEPNGSGSPAMLIIAASLAVGLSLGLHRPLLASLLGSFDRWLLASPQAWLPGPELGSWMIAELVAFTGLALALATPVLLTRALVELGSASLGRAGFEAASLSAAITPSLRLAAALVALGAAWSAYPEAFARGL